MSATTRCSPSCTSPAGRARSTSRRTSRPPRKSCDDDAESIITNERYVYIAAVITACYKKKNAGKLSASDKIDRVVTNRWLGLPIFAVVMFLVYWIAMVAVGAPATDWANDGVFGDGWHLLGIGSGAYNDANDEYTAATEAVGRVPGVSTPKPKTSTPTPRIADMKDVRADSDTATVDGRGRGDARRERT